MPGTLNVWSNTSKYIPQVATAPGFANLLFGFEYGVSLINTTDQPITSGTITFEEADAKPDNQCEPDVWAPMEPIAGCGAIVTGVPDVGPVHYEITPERPIPPYGACNVAAPCPKQFLRVTGLPAGVEAMVVITRPRRWDNTDPSLMFIPRPIMQPWAAPFAAAAPLAAQTTQATVAPRAPGARAAPAAPPAPRTGPRQAPQRPAE